MRAGMVVAVMVVAGLAGRARGGESVTVPWDEFKRLYAESVKREVIQSLPAKEAPAVISIEEAAYRLKVEAGSASGRVSIAGRAMPGRPEPLRLFGDDVVIAAVESVKGGTLVASGGGLALLPAEKSEFQVELSVLLPVREDSVSKLVSFRPPPALRNSLAVELPQRVKLVAASGLAGRDGVRHFAGAGAVEVRFAEAPIAAVPAAPPAPPPPEIDVLTHVTVQERRVTLDSCLAPARPVPGPVVVKLPAGARYAGSSLKSVWVEKSGETALKLNLPAGFAESFTVQCVLERAAGDGETALALPAVEGNAGREGFLALEQPDDAEVRLAGEGLLEGLAPARLPASLRELAARGGCARAAPGSQVTLAVRRFQAVKAPEVVLDAVYFFTAFEEDGGALSVLRLKLPAAAGPRLRLARVEGAEIWSLRVNGEKKEVYSLDRENWIVPLAAGKDSDVELAFLRRGEKLALHGRLDAVLPEMGLSARKLCLGVALPARVDLLSVEGDLSPAAGEEWPVPAGIAGKRYFFARAFYKGEEIKAGLYYKEPVEREKEVRP